MPLAIDDLTELIIGSAIAVHNALGPGLLESVYGECLLTELDSKGLTADVERSVPIVYRGREIRDHLRLDMIVDGRVIVEIKAVERLHPVHQAQVITYLKLTGCPAGLLFNSWPPVREKQPQITPRQAATQKRSPIAGSKPRCL